MARNYKRDSKGRFASTGSSGGKKGGARSKKKDDAIRADIISRFDKLLATPPAGGPPVRKAAAAAPSAKPSAARSRSRKPANNVNPSPRRLNKQEQIAASVMTSSKFRSDRQRIKEMVRRGVNPSTDFTGLVGNVRSKLGGKMTDTVRSAAARRRRKP
jgi:hypothetical protein